MTKDVWIDPIVEEVRAAHAALFSELDYNLERLHDRIMRSQERHATVS